jgi:thiamine-phosphate pyrophosphorylase
VAGLYAVTPDLADTALMLARTQSALAGGARLVQYRNKSADADLRHEQASALLQLCRRRSVPLIINDDVARSMPMACTSVPMMLRSMRRALESVAKK